MAENETPPFLRRKCRRCNADLPAGVPEELCPKCLLEAGLATEPPRDAGATVRLSPAAVKSRGLPQPGEQFGHYTIIRTLGEGGMGAVFEAEDLDSGRRVALKVLSQALEAPEARTRFLREGRLAASINHPNSVYVFGTEEIGGTPVIAMELVPGGTLHDRVQVGGALPLSTAVDYMLEVIAGLEAAQRIGILHRDIKPSNCFLGDDGAVKIGDFGLSISTAVRTEPALTGTGAFLGTPAYCSPEQLRGEELNVRSDMYSVGVTLFFLLTGRTPFEGQNMVQLLATVLEKRAPSPRQFRKEIPQGLARVILRCLEKQPGDRYKTYDELRQALAPYTSAAPTPATLGLRFLAGTLDQLLVALAGLAAIAPFAGPMEIVDRLAQSPQWWIAWSLGAFCIVSLYYAIGEGIWGATVGKATCRLRVVGPDNSAPGLRRGLVRALFYVVLPVLPFWIASRGDPLAYLRGPTAMQYVLQLSFYVVLALLFCTVRRRNGFAAVHDLVTRTRVISRKALQVRPALAAVEGPPPAVETKPLVGPYHVLETMGTSDRDEWLLGYDLRLLRKVWLRVVPPGTPPVPASRRNLARVGRLRWLTGRRSPEENWDAFEGVGGRPLMKLVQSRRPWSEVRYWLYDLAAEINAASKDGTLPPELGLDRVWITDAGRAKLLDFPAPGLEAGSGPIPASSRFLGDVAVAALSGPTESGAELGSAAAVPLPLHAQAFLGELERFPDAGALKITLKPLLPRLATVSRLRRAAVVAGCLVFPLFIGTITLFSGSLLQKWNQHYPGLLELNALLQHRSATHRFGKPGQGPSDEHYSVFIAAHYRSLITNQSAWSSPMALAMVKGDARRFAEQSVEENPAPTEKQIAEANAALEPYAQQATFPDFFRRPDFLFIIVNGILVLYVVVPALLAALLFRGGLVLRIANVTFVRRDGSRASRLRVFGRGLVAWSPVALGIVLFGMFGRGHPVLGQLTAYALICSLAVLSAALPERGLPDRLAGTWPVPR